MFNNNKILVVIPARGGSKGIPRKNIRLLAEKPLISYTIDLAKNSQYVDDVVVTTEDSEIALIAEKFGASVVRRSNELASDEIPLDPVVYDAMVQKEKQAFDEYDLVITVQPTSPLLKTSTLDKAIEKFEDFGIDSVISVVDDRHLTWGYNQNDNRYFPLYSQRVNRQYLPVTYRETGSILASRRTFITENSRLGNTIDLIEISKEESVDIDSYEDWWIAENYINKKRIAIVVNAYDEIGTGHVYRCLSIASKLVFHDVLFLIDENHQLGVDIVNSYNYPFKTYDGSGELFNILEKFNPQMVINDILDTSQEYIQALKQRDYFVVNFEDLGMGTKEADLVFDALYEHDENEANVYTGHKYYILRDEFYFQPSKIITHEVNNVLITFGGTDPNNFTKKVLESLLSIDSNMRIDIILGFGYPAKEELIEEYSNYDNVQIYTNVANISEYMFRADIIFTSAGRTMYEICSLGIPCICLCQNERELTHVFGNHDNGFINMGLGENITSEEIINQFLIVADDYELRQNMNQRMLAVDLKHGFDNIWDIVKSTYENR